MEFLGKPVIFWHELEKRLLTDKSNGLVDVQALMAEMLEYRERAYAAEGKLADLKRLLQCTH